MVLFVKGINNSMFIFILKSHDFPCEFDGSSTFKKKMFELLAFLCLLLFENNYK